MIRRLFMIGILVAVMFAVSSTASASTSSAQRTMHAKKVYFHSVGYINAIWKNARRTVYHPNHAKRMKWIHALEFLKHRRDVAWKKLHPRPQLEKRLVDAFSCIHHYEGAWNANTGNGYYGGLQMDMTFQSTYGSDFMTQWGTADNWPVYAQLQAAIRAYKSGRGFYPWPQTARYCHLI